MRGIHSYPVVDVFRTVIGVKTLDFERKLIHQRLQRRDQIVLADAFNRRHNLALRGFVYRIDMVDALAFVEVSLVY